MKTKFPLEPHYSGKLSWDFWDYVKILRGEDHAQAYALGVALQNLEEQVLQHINEAISDTTSK